MTWELVTFLSVLMVCGTYFMCQQVNLANLADDEPLISLEEFEALKLSIETVKAEHETILKLAEETKKLLSQQNLAQSFRGTR